MRQDTVKNASDGTVKGSNKVVFFDVGATLILPAVQEGETIARIATNFGLALDADAVSQLVPAMYRVHWELHEGDESFWADDKLAKGIWIEMYQWMAAKLDVPQNLHDALAHSVYDFYFSSGAWVPYDDVMPTLDALKNRGLRLGIISNWDSSLAPILEGMGLSRYFDTIVASAVVKAHKPQPAIFEAALRTMGASAHDALHVGDRKGADVWGARGAGITGVLLDRDNRHKDFAGPRITTLLQLLEMI